MNPKYCFICGSEIAYVGRQQIGYNSETGEHEYHDIFECPKRSFWNLGHFTTRIEIV